jgi:hypothetical protein
MCEHLLPVNPKLIGTDDFQPFNILDSLALVGTALRLYTVYMRYCCWTDAEPLVDRFRTSL